MNRLQVPKIYSILTKTVDQNVASAASPVIDWNAVSNVGNIAGSATNNEFVFNERGWYLFHLACYWDGEATPNGSRRAMIIQWDTGSGYTDLRLPQYEMGIQDGNTLTHNATFLLGPIEAGYKVRAYVTQASGETLILFGDAVHTRFTAVRLPLRLDD